MSQVAKVNGFRPWMASRIKGQEEVLCALDEHIGRSELGLTAPGLPLGGFLFVGPTGVGKTETAKSLTEYLFGGSAALCRLDMSEFKAASSVEELRGLIGARRAGGARTFLFDEIEKAHPDVFNILLQVLDDGRLTDGQGRTVDFKNTVLIMTSNVGSQSILDPSMKDEAKHKAVMEALRERFRPEFLNRIDEIVIYNSLGENQIAGIVKVQLELVVQRLKAKKITVDFKDALLRDVVDELKDMVTGLKVLLDSKGGVSANSKVTYKGKDVTVAEALNGLCDNGGDLGWYVISKKGDAYNGLVKIVKSKERGYAGEETPAKDKKDKKDK